MALFDTGWLSVINGQTTQIAVPKGRLISAQVRWKGRKRVDIDQTTTSRSLSDDGTGHTSGLAAPAGAGALIRVSASHSVSAPVSGNWQVTVQTPNMSKATKSGYGTGGSVSQTSLSPGGSTYVSFTGSFDSDPPENAVFSYSVTATWQTSTTLQTISPKITVGGQQTQHVGTVNDGVVTDWYAAAGFVAGQVNDVLHTISGSARAYVQILIEYDPALTVVLLAPEMFGRATRDDLVFRVSASVPDGNEATAWFPAVLASQSEDLESPDYTWDASEDQTDWEYWDNVTEAWVALTGAGAPISAPVRFTPPTTEMGLGRWYWAARAWDDDTEAWGDVSANRLFRLVLSLVSRFACEIAGVDRSHQVQRVVISETTNGELGSMTFQIHVPDGGSPPDVGDPVAMGIRDAAGNEEQFDGIVCEIPSRLGPGLYQVDCKLPDAVLAERYVLEDYTSQDVGLVVKDIIDTYCAPLLSTGVNTSTGYVRPVAAFGKTALDVLKELREQYGLMFWVTSTDGVVYLVDPADLDAAILTVTRGRAG